MTARLAGGARFVCKRCVGSQAKQVAVVSDAGGFRRGCGEWRHGARRQSGMMAQLLVDPPLLLNRRKFHLRLYALLPSWRPLRVLLFREGLALFATAVYSGAALSKNRRAWLTNSALNMQPGGGLLARLGLRQAIPPNTSALVWDMARLRRALGAAAFDAVWARIEAATMQLFCNWPVGARGSPFVSTRKGSGHTRANLYEPLPPPHEHVSDCFDLLGVDVLVGADLSVSVLEVNLQPSMEIKSDVHRRVKESLWREILKVAVAPALAEPPERYDEALVRSARRIRRDALRCDAGAGRSGTDASTPPSAAAAAAAVCALGEDATALQLHRMRAMDEAIRASGFANVYPPWGGAAAHAAREQCVGSEPGALDVLLRELRADHATRT